jgi:hypothetical protein
MTTNYNKVKTEGAEEFDKKFTDNGGGFRNVWIYRDGGQKVIGEFKSFLSTYAEKVHKATLEDVREEILNLPFITLENEDERTRILDYLSSQITLKP